LELTFTPNAVAVAVGRGRHQHSFSPLVSQFPPLPVLVLQVLKKEHCVERSPIPAGFIKVKIELN